LKSKIKSLEKLNKTLIEQKNFITLEFEKQREVSEKMSKEN